MSLRNYAGIIGIGLGVLGCGGEMPQKKQNLTIETKGEIASPTIETHNRIAECLRITQRITDINHYHNELGKKPLDVRVERALNSCEDSAREAEAFQIVNRYRASINACAKAKELEEDIKITPYYSEEKRSSIAERRHYKNKCLEAVAVKNPEAVKELRLYYHDKMECWQKLIPKEFQECSNQ